MTRELNHHHWWKHIRRLPAIQMMELTSTRARATTQKKAWNRWQIAVICRVARHPWGDWAHMPPQGQRNGIVVRGDPGKFFKKTLFEKPQYQKQEQ